jgi:hypothetical protein
MNDYRFRIIAIVVSCGFVGLLSGCGDQFEVACEKQLHQQKNERQTVSMAARKTMLKSCVQSARASEGRGQVREGYDR